MRLLQTLLPLAFGSLAAAASLQVHDASFVPDAVLVVTEGSRKQSCVPEKEILLVNGTSPGPALRFKEGQTVWIRVYNNVHTQNLTMVSIISQLFPTPKYTPKHFTDTYFSTGMG